MQIEAQRLHVFSDFDGTITQLDTLVFMATHLGGGPEMVQRIGRLIRENEISLRDGIAAEMRSIRTPFAEAAALLQAEVQIDPHFDEFVQWCQTANVPLTILSAGFAQTVELFLPSARYPQLEVLANQLQPNTVTGWQCEFRDQSTDGHDKTKALQAARERGQVTVFIGDGLSDRGAAGVADVVLAKHSLALYCRERAIAFTPYETFADVLAHLRNIVRVA